jgi:hypothetical protein
MAEIPFFTSLSLSSLLQFASLSLSLGVSFSLNLSISHSQPCVRVKRKGKEMRKKKRKKHRKGRAYQMGEIFAPFCFEREEGAGR